MEACPGREGLSPRLLSPSRSPKEGKRSHRIPYRKEPVVTRQANPTGKEYGDTTQKGKDSPCAISEYMIRT
jgi:hypothetical protein